MKTPILFLTFNRPDTTKLVFEKIREYKPKQLFVSVDGPRLNKPSEAQKVSEVVKIVKNIDWECDVKYNINKNNKGCKIAVADAITWFFKHVEEGIILEDDCLPNNSFFNFASNLLNKYKNDKNVFLISGFNPMQETKIEESYFFSKYPFIWGWACWRDRWQKYDITLKEWPENKHLLNQLQLKKQRITQEKLFDKMKNQKINTWDIQVSYSLLKQNAYSIVPKKSLIENIGFSINATHTIIRHDVADVKAKKLTFPLKHPKNKKTNFDIELYNSFNPNLFKKLRSAIKTMVHYIKCRKKI